MMVPSLPPDDVAYGRSYWDPLWAEFQEQGVPLSLHPSSGGTSGGNILYPEFAMPSWWTFTTNGVDLPLGYMSFFQESAFDRFPEMKVLDTGIGVRVDAVACCSEWMRSLKSSASPRP